MFIVSTMLVLSFTICALFIHTKWKFYSKGMIYALRSYNLLSRIWPCDYGFVSLIFSAFRHTLIPFIFTLLIWFVNNDKLNSILLYLSLLYAISTILRHKERRKDFISAGEASRKMLKPIKSACFSVIICAFANYFILLICTIIH